MSGRSDGRSEAMDEAVVQALTDHHLDEVADMIERAQTERRAFESPSGDGAAGLFAAHSALRTERLAVSHFDP